jgi:transcription antitermination factor NusG
MLLTVPDSSALVDTTLGRSTEAAASWHVLWARSNCEQLVHDQLVSRGFHVFLPTIEVWSRRTGVRRVCRMPMFAGYLFLHHALDKYSDVEVRKARGLVAILGDSWERRATVPANEIDAIQRLVHGGLPAMPYPFLKQGQRVRITRGPMADVEGILVRTRPNKGLLVLSVQLVSRSVAVEVDCTMAVPV